MSSSASEALLVTDSKTHLDQLVSGVFLCVWHTLWSLAHQSPRSACLHHLLVPCLLSRALTLNSSFLPFDGASRAPSSLCLNHSPKSAYLCCIWCPLFSLAHPLTLSALLHCLLVRLVPLLVTGFSTHLDHFVSAACWCSWCTLWLWFKRPPRSASLCHLPCVWCHLWSLPQTFTLISSSFPSFSASGAPFVH